MDPEIKLDDSPMKGFKGQAKNKEKSKAPKDDKKKKQQPAPELPEKKNKQKIDELKVRASAGKEGALKLGLALARGEGFPATARPMEIQQGWALFYGTWCLLGLM